MSIRIKEMVRNNIMCKCWFSKKIDNKVTIWLVFVCKFVVNLFLYLEFKDGFHQFVCSEKGIKYYLHSDTKREH